LRVLKTLITLTKERSIKTNDWIFLLLASIIPISDRAFLLFSQQLWSKMVADVIICFLFFCLIFFKKYSFFINIRLLIPIFLSTFLPFLFIFTEITEASLRQAVSLCLSIVYVFLIVACIERCGLIRFGKFVIWLSGLNCFFIVLTGFFPEVFSFLLSNFSQEGREVLGYKLPFIRNAGFYNHYAYFGVSLLGALLVFEYMRKVSEVGKVHYFLYWILSYSAVIVSQSRVVLIGLLFVHLLLFSYKVKISFVYKLTSILALLIIFNIEIFEMWNMLIEIKKGTFDQRLDQINIGFNIFAENPIFGSGYSSFSEENPDQVLHNIFFNILSSIGLVGLSFFILMNLSLLYIQKYRYERHIVAIFLFGMYIILSGSSGLSFYSLWQVVAIAIAIAIHSKRANNLKES